MPTGTLFSNNRTQAVRLPVETRFPSSVKHVSVRVVGQERILAPVDATWDSFFAAEALQAPADFLTERAEQFETPREAF